jgi:TfoX-like protein
MSPKAAPTAPPDRVIAYDRLVAAVAEVERKGATMPYTSVNGNMFSYLDASGSMALRLSATGRAAFIEQYETTLHEAYGIVQKEYVTVPAKVLDDTDGLLPWFRSSLAYALTLKAKPAKRRA